MKQHSHKRWLKAQEYEKDWWSKIDEDMDLEFYQYYADLLLKDVEGICSILESTKILEIGSGAAGILTHLDSNHRYAIDPLEDYYSQVKNFKDYRDPKVQYKQSRGENLPYEDNFFDLIIMDNVLDHCEDPESVMRECDRVLAEKGILYIRQHTFGRWGLMMRYIMELIEIDPGHPHSFSIDRLRRLYSRYNFQVLKENQTGFKPNWIADIKSSELKKWIKAVLFITWNNVDWVLQKS